jgi:hypothetical protein
MGSDERDALLVPKAGDFDCWVNMTVVLIKEEGLRDTGWGTFHPGHVDR